MCRLDTYIEKLLCEVSGPCSIGAGAIGSLQMYVKWKVRTQCEAKGKSRSVEKKKQWVNQLFKRKTLKDLN